MDDRVSVESPRTGILLAFRVLDTPQIAKVHWNEGLGREVPCFGAHCRLCPMPTRRKGFVAAVTLPRMCRGLSREQNPSESGTVRAVIELTDSVLYSVKEADGDTVLWELRRDTGSRRINVTRKHAECMYRLPKTFDPRPIVAKMWGVEVWPFTEERSERLDDDAPPILPLKRVAQ